MLEFAPSLVLIVFLQTELAVSSKRVRTKNTQQINNQKQQVMGWRGLGWHCRLLSKNHRII